MENIHQNDAITLVGITKTFGKVVANKNISLAWLGRRGKPSKPLAFTTLLLTTNGQKDGNIFI